MSCDVMIDIETLGRSERAVVLSIGAVAFDIERPDVSLDDLPAWYAALDLQPQIDNGRLVEGAPPDDNVHLADLDADMGERTNLKDKYPDLTAELTDAARNWHAQIVDRWTHEWQGKINGATGYTKK